MIASQYLKTENISRIISDFRLKSPISYIVWEDFIDEDIYKSIEREILAEAYVDAREHNDIHRNNKRPMGLAGALNQRQPQPSRQCLKESV